MKMLVSAAVVCLASGCMQFRQQAVGATPAPGIGPSPVAAAADSAYCPDMSQGCKQTVWAIGWGAYNVHDVTRADCGDVGLAEVTVRSQPLTFLVSMVTLGLVTPRRVEWKCKAPTPSEGTLHENGF